MRDRDHRPCTIAAAGAEIVLLADGLGAWT